LLWTSFIACFRDISVKGRVATLMKNRLWFRSPKQFFFPQSSRNRDDYYHLRFFTRVLRPSDMLRACRIL
jgi:hypothetical protein